jgi:hypothetical protein
VGRVPTALAQQAPQLQLSSVAVSAVAGCGLHEFEDRTWQVKAVTLSALPADPCLTVVMTAAAAHPGAAPPTLYTLSDLDTPLWLSLCVWHLKNTVPLLLLTGLLLLRLGYRLTLPLVACHL